MSPRVETTLQHCIAVAAFFVLGGNLSQLKGPVLIRREQKLTRKSLRKRECLKSLVVNQKILRKSPRKRKRVFKQPGGQPNVSVSLSQGSQGHPLLSTHRSITLGLLGNKPGNIRELCPTQRLINFFVQIFPQCAPRFSDKSKLQSCNWKKRVIPFCLIRL